MSHHMMDGHVVSRAVAYHHSLISATLTFHHLTKQIHHLFFTKVPHYRLEAATKALKTGMEEAGMGDMYKSIDTPDFTQEIVQQFNDNWFFVDEKQIVRE